MTPLKEIIEGLHMKANCHYNPSMDGTRDAYMEGRKEAYLDCANILEKWRKSIDEQELDKLTEKGFNDYLKISSWHTVGGYKDGFKACYRKIMEE